MPWVKLDDHFPDHAKLAECGVLHPLCGWLYVCGLAFCNRQLTDGRIPKEHVGRLMGTSRLTVQGDPIQPEAIAHRLVSVGLWEDAGDAYLVHDYLGYQPSRASVLKERADTAERVKTWRNGRRNGASNTPRNDASNDVSTTSPVPEPSTDQKQDQDPGLTAGIAPCGNVEKSTNFSAPSKGENPKAIAQVALDVLRRSGKPFADADVKDETKALCVKFGLAFTADTLRKGLDAAEHQIARVSA